MCCLRARARARTPITVAIYEITVKFSYQLYYIRNEAALPKLMYNEIYVSKWLHEPFLAQQWDCSALLYARGRMKIKKRKSKRQHLPSIFAICTFFIWYHNVIDIMDLIAFKFLTIDKHGEDAVKHTSTNCQNAERCSCFWNWWQFVTKY